MIEKIQNYCFYYYLFTICLLIESKRGVVSHVRCARANCSGKSESDVIMSSKKGASHLIYMRITFFRCAKSVLSYSIDFSLFLLPVSVFFYNDEDVCVQHCSEEEDPLSLLSYFSR